MKTTYNVCVRFYSFENYCSGLPYGDDFEFFCNPNTQSEEDIKKLLTKVVLFEDFQKHGSIDFIINTEEEYLTSKYVYDTMVKFCIIAEDLPWIEKSYFRCTELPDDGTFSSVEFTFSAPDKERIAEILEEISILMIED